MNKQDLIKRYEMKLKDHSPFNETVSYSLLVSHFLDELKRLDEPQKVTVPQFVASWIKYCKLTGVDLYHALEMGDLYLGNYAYQKDYPKLKGYFENETNQDLFARAWLDGYTVEEEKRYFVRLKGVVDNLRLLRHNSPTNTWTIGSEEQCFNVSRAHTRKELEEANFGWVFDCEGIEIEEVGE